MSPTLCILIVDDEREVNAVLSALLAEKGHRTVACRSGLEALMKLQGAPQPFDLVITDHHMPGSLAGLDFVRVARTKGYQTPVVVMSGHLTPALEESYVPFHVLGFLPKPFDMQILQTFLEAVARAVPPATAAKMEQWNSVARAGSSYASQSRPA